MSNAEEHKELEQRIGAHAQLEFFSFYFIKIVYYGLNVIYFKILDISNINLN